MLAERGLLFVGEAQPSGLFALLAREVLPAGVGERDRVEEAELRLLGGGGEQRLDLDLGAGPVLEVDERGDQVGPHLGPRLILGQQVTVHLDLAARLLASVKDGRLAEPRFDIVGPDLQHLVERPVRIRGQPEGQERTADPHPRGKEPRLQVGRLPVESQGQRGDAPVEPRPSPMHDLIELLSARQQPLRLPRRTPRLLPQHRLKAQLARELGEPRTLDQSTAPSDHVVRYREGKMPGSEDHDMDRSREPVGVEQPFDRIERHLVRVLEERVEEPIPGAEEESLGRRTRGVEALTHRLHEGSRELDERSGCHRGRKPT